MHLDYFLWPARAKAIAAVLEAAAAPTSNTTPNTTSLRLNLDVAPAKNKHSGMLEGLCGWGYDGVGVQGCLHVCVD